MKLIPVPKSVKDITGQTFGRLTAIGLTDEVTRDHKRLWLFKCNCKENNYIKAIAYHVTSGMVSSCGCIRTENAERARQIRKELARPSYKDLTGKRFGKLVAIERLPELTKNGRAIWKCQCDCGEYVTVSIIDLTSNRITSCPNCKPKTIRNAPTHRAPTSEDLTGRTFGRLYVTGRSDHRDKHGRLLWHCVCSCDKHGEKDLLGNVLKSGLVRSCGCLQRETMAANRKVPTFGNGNGFKDITGQTFADGNVTVLRRHPENSKDRKAQWVCKCNLCGNEFVTTGKSLRTGNTKSCGCLVGLKCAARNRTHGLFEDPKTKRIASIHHDMIRRCYDKRRDDYNNYGGRGVYICDEWYTPGVDGNPGLVNFYNWSIAHGYSPDLSIDRIDNDGPYAPWNCRWTTNMFQANNKRSNRHIYDGEEVLTFSEFERKYVMKESSISHMLYSGQDIDLIVYNAKHPDNKAYYNRYTGEYMNRDGYIILIPALQNAAVMKGLIDKDGKKKLHGR